MIRGVGVDAVHVPSFAAQLAEPGTTFEHQTFTPGERAQARARPGGPARSLAARFAAKEALIKALSAERFGAPPPLPCADLREVEVVSDAWGRPALRLHGRIAEVAGEARTHLSLTHDGEMALAFVVLERDG